VASVVATRSGDSAAAWIDIFFDSKLAKRDTDFLADTPTIVIASCGYEDEESASEWIKRMTTSKPTNSP
jgi:hypothetical protein